MSESELEVSEARGREILTLLRRLLDDDVHPTLRAVGVSGAEAQWLAKAQLIVLGDTRAFGNAGNIAYEDRYVIAEISDTALAWLAKPVSSVPPIHQVQIVSPPESKSAKTFRVMGKGLWDLIKIGLPIAGSLWVAWFVWKRHWK